MMPLRLQDPTFHLWIPWITMNRLLMLLISRPATSVILVTITCITRMISIWIGMYQARIQIYLIFLTKGGYTLKQPQFMMA